jgi:hypothetical protein
MDIIGFDAQINAPRAITKLINKSKAIRPVATAPIPVATAPRPVATAPRPVTMAPRPVVTTPKKVFSMPRPIAPRPVATAPRPKANIKMTAKTFSNVMPTSPAADRAIMQIVKQNGKSIPVSSLRKTRNANIVEKVSPVQRSYMPVDLPYQKVTPKSKMVRIVNTPFVYPVNINMIEPAVDSGVSNYYGK